MNHPIYIKNLKNEKTLPDKVKAEQWTEAVFNWLFSIGAEYRDYDFFLKKEAQIWAVLTELLEDTQADVKSRFYTASTFSDQLKVIHSQLESDLEAVFQFDPAAKSIGEVLIAYPGFFAITVYRLAHEFWNRNIPILPRIMTEYVHSKTGIDIHPGAQIGERFFIDHGTGIVIGETSVIGNDVKIYQGVTLGALTVSKEKAEMKRHPTIGNNVTIYANATILGGNTVIGDNAVIGGNVWITHSIPEKSLVYHKSEIIIKNKAEFPEPLNFVI